MVSETFDHFSLHFLISVLSYWCHWKWVVILDPGSQGQRKISFVHVRCRTNGRKVEKPSFLCLKRLTVWLLCFCLHVIFAYAFWNSVLAVIKEVFVMASDNVSLVLLAVKFSFVIFTDMKYILINIYSTNIYSLAELKVLIICCQLSVTTFSILTKYAQSILKKAFKFAYMKNQLSPLWILSIMLRHFKWRSTLIGVKAFWYVVLVSNKIT